MLRRSALFALLAICLWTAPVLVRADASCDSVMAQNMARQGFQYLGAERWQDARVTAGQLAVYAKGCSDPKIGFPSVVYSAYIGAAALHGLGEDARAAQTWQAGMWALGVLKKDGGYPSLVAAMEPKFATLARELKVPVVSPEQVEPPAPASSLPPGSVIH